MNRNDVRWVLVVLALEAFGTAFAVSTAADWMIADVPLMGMVSGCTPLVALGNLVELVGVSGVSMLANAAGLVLLVVLYRMGDKR